METVSLQKYSISKMVRTEVRQYRQIHWKLWETEINWYIIIKILLTAACPKIIINALQIPPQKEASMSNIIPINDLSAPELDVYARLSENQLLCREHPEQGLFIAESPNVICRALDAGCVPCSFLVEDRHVKTQARDLIARCGDIPVYTAPFDVLTRLTGFKLTRGMLCAMRRPPLSRAEAICRGARRAAVLENVMNPTTVGAIFRSAAALGMDAVLLTEGCCDPLYRRAIRVSMGTVFQVPWAWIDDVSVLGGLGFKTAAMALTGDPLSLRDPRLAREDRLAIVLGTEGDGLAPATIARCDYTVRIPMAHGVDSLNVAAASAVAFWQLGNQEE